MRAENHARELTRTEAHRVYREHLRNDFPRDERKPWARIERSWRQGRYFAYGLFEQREDGEALTAYAFFYMEPGRRAALLDYYAVVSGLRDEGYGSFFLRALAGALVPGRCEMILIEAENPAFAVDEAERGVRNRRVAFYTERCGAADTGLRYLLFGVHYVIFTLGAPDSLDADALRQLAETESTALYSGMLPEDLFARHFAIER